MENLTISKGLVKHLETKSNSGIIMEKVSDALSLNILSDRNTVAIVGLVDDLISNKELPRMVSSGLGRAKHGIKELGEDPSRYIPTIENALSYNPATANVPKHPGRARDVFY